MVDISKLESALEETESNSRGSGDFTKFLYIPKGDVTFMPIADDVAADGFSEFTADYFQDKGKVKVTKRRMVKVVVMDWPKDNVSNLPEDWQAAIHFMVMPISAYKNLLKLAINKTGKGYDFATTDKKNKLVGDKNMVFTINKSGSGLDTEYLVTFESTEDTPRPTGEVVPATTTLQLAAQEYDDWKRRDAGLTDENAVNGSDDDSDMSSQF